MLYYVEGLGKCQIWTVFSEEKKNFVIKSHVIKPHFGLKKRFLCSLS